MCLHNLKKSAFICVYLWMKIVLNYLPLKFPSRRSKKDCTPSFASSDANSARICGVKCSFAFSNPSDCIFRADSMVARTPRRGLFCNRFSDFDGFFNLLSVRRNFLHQADSQRFVCVKFVARQKPAHRVSPTGDFGKSKSRAAERENSALDLDLCKRRVFRRDTNIGRQQKFDADGQTFALNGGDNRLCP